MAELIKVWVFFGKNPGYFVQGKKKKSAHKLLRKVLIINLAYLTEI